jgi:ribosomal protein S14
MTLFAIGFVLVLAFLYVSAEKAERYWHNKAHRPQPVERMPPLFRTSHDQCAVCGREGDLLNLDEVCRECFDLQISRR